VVADSLKLAILQRLVKNFAGGAIGIDLILPIHGGVGGKPIVSRMLL
jgi:hypothetical protein